MTLLLLVRLGKRIWILSLLMIFSFGSNCKFTNCSYREGEMMDVWDMATMDGNMFLVSHKV